MLASGRSQLSKGIGEAWAVRVIDTSLPTAAQVVVFRVERALIIRYASRGGSGFDPGFC
ncbi:hypothetical protein D3C80_2239010 [compost metagenome]